MVERRIAALIPVCLLIQACPPRLPVDFGKAGEAKSPAELLKRIDLAETTVVGVKGDGKLYVDTPRGKGSVAIFVGVQDPASVHLEQLDFFGKPQGVLVTDGKQFGLYLAEENRYYRGPASAANLARFLPVVLPPEELAALLLGRVPRMPAESQELRFDDQQGLYVLTLHRGAATQTLVVQPPSHRVIKSVVQGVRAYDVELGELTAFGGVTLPKKLILDVAQAKTHVELTYKDVTVNEPPDASLFDPTPPEGMPVVEVDEKGVPREAPKP